MVIDTIRSSFQRAVGIQDIQLGFPDKPEHGDFTTNISLQISQEVRGGDTPRKFADKLVEKLSQDPDLMNVCGRLEIAGPGFINIFLKEEILIEELQLILKEVDRYGLNKSLEGQKVMVEYTDPNPFKEFHIGHLYPNLVGETVSRLYEASGATVARASYQGDVGLHVAKALWGLFRKLKEDSVSIEELKNRPLSDRVFYLGQGYSLGASAYEESDEFKQQINELNKKVYAKDAEIYSLYHLGRSWSLEYFETMYERLGTKFDYYYFESEVSPNALDIVRNGLGKAIFEESEGAVVYKGESDGLHTRVFINKLGLPTYEAKDLALAPRKYKDFPYDTSIIVTANEVNTYFKVVFSAMKLIFPELYQKTIHIGHGMVKLPEGKISSRSGKVITAEWLLNEARAKAATLSDAMRQNEEASEAVGLAAVRYALLKGGIGGDVEFSFESSVTFTGNSGPYLQYTYARTQSILKKGEFSSYRSSQNPHINVEERDLLSYLSRFPEIIVTAQKNYSPSSLCTYLYEVSQKFNTFYNLHQVVGSDQEAFRLNTTAAVGQVIKNGLLILGIKALPHL